MADVRQVHYSEWVAVAAVRSMLAAGALLGALGPASSAWAQMQDYKPPDKQPKQTPKQTEPKDEDADGSETEIDPNRPYAVFQVGGAVLAMPAAELCPVSEDSCEPAETALGFKLQSLARIQNFGFGAGITWGFGLRSTEVAGDPSLERELTRSYFLV